MFLRIIKSSVFIIISVAILGGGFFVGIYSRDYYKGWQDRQSVRNLMKSYEQAQKDEEARKMADTYGGKTPQETLQMFIDAVEKGDYELASRYFVEKKREDEKNKLGEVKNNDYFISVLKKVKIDDKEKIISKIYDEGLDQFGTKESKDEFIKRISELYKNTATMSTKIQGYDYTVNFILYPNGIWKLTEI